MSEESGKPEDPKVAEDAGEDDAPISTPFEKPFFMPVLLLALALWFGYDGWFNEEMEWIKFNRYTFGILMILAIYTTYQDVRVIRKSKESEKDS